MNTPLKQMKANIVKRQLFCFKIFCFNFENEMKLQFCVRMSVGNIFINKTKKIVYKLRFSYLVTLTM